MKYIIDLIEDVREQIGNHEEYMVTAGLLKTDSDDSSKLIYAGEAHINTYHLDEVSNELCFKIYANDAKITTGELLPSLLILDMDMMMYTIKIDINKQYKSMEIVGFGKNDEQKRYILFIKI